MDQPNPNQPHQHDPNDLAFNVMPQDGKSLSGNSKFATASAPTPGAPIGPGQSRKWPYLIIGAVVLLALGGGAYYMLGTEKDADPQAVVNTLSKQFLNDYFNTETCEDDSTCGMEADPDSDGLGNHDEWAAGTNPLNPDHDGDGLADGDEVNIYKTEPKLKYTDRRVEVAANNWTDGYQIKNGFDPLDPAKKFTTVRLQQIKSAIEQYKLHEPTITTLGTSTASPSPSSNPAIPADWKTYTNAQYGIEFKYPKELTVKDLKDVKKLGVAIEFPSKTLFSYVEELVEDLKGTKTSVTVSGKKYDMWTLTEGGITINRVVISTNKEIFLVNSNVNTTDFNLFNQILSTFKFTK